MERQVVHINVANFMAAVEEQCDPALKDEPFVVASGTGGRTIVLDLSEKAYAEGVRRGQTLSQVRRLGRITVIEPRIHIYRRAETRLRGLAGPMAPLIEGLSGGHLFCDISGTKSIFGNPVDHTVRLRREISSRLGIEPIVGLARNRLVSKVATRVVKPHGFITVKAGDEAEFLRHQDISLLPGVGERLLHRMTLLGIREMGTLADLDDNDAGTALGRRGTLLRDSARGIDTTPVVDGTVRDRTIKREVLFEMDTSDRQEVLARLFILTEDAGSILRQNGMLAGALELEVTYTDGKAYRARRLMARPSLCDMDIFERGRAALDTLMTRRVRLRGLALSITDLCESGRQMDLFEPAGHEKRESLQKSIDLIRSRYGRSALTVGYALKAAGREQ